MRHLRHCRTSFMFLWLVTGIFLSPALGFKIVDPKAHSIHKPGEQLTVRLDLGEVSDIAHTNFYWYAEDEDMLEELAEERLALVATAESQPPFGGILEIPLEAIGVYRLLAVAELAGTQFRRDTWAIFDEILLNIQPDAELAEIDFETEKPLRLGRAGSAVVYDQVDFLGKIIPLPVVGVFADGVVRSIRSHTTGTTYRSSNEQVVTINEDGLLRLVGNGTATITVQNRGKVATLDVEVEVNEEPNEPPIADPGPDQVVAPGTRVQLNALNSYDPEGGSLQYYWSQVRGSRVPLLDPYSAQASFLAPHVPGERLFRFKLRVTDIKGADSLPAYVDVIVRP